MLDQDSMNKINLTLKDLKWDISKEEITKKYEVLVHETDEKIDRIIKLEKKQRNFQNTIAAFESLTSDFYNYQFIMILEIASLYQEIRDEARKFEEMYTNYATDLIYREDLYNSIQEYVEGNFLQERENLNEIDTFLLEKIIRDFKRVGHGLGKDQKMRLKEISKEITSLSIQYSKTLNENKETLIFSKDDLEGVPESKLSSFKMDSNKNYIVTLKNPDYFLVMKFAKNFSTRVKILKAYMNRGFPENSERFKKVLSLRREFATVLGYENYASFVQEIRMAKNPKNVEDFLGDLTKKTRIIAEKDFEEFKKLKFEELGENSDEIIHEADVNYYERINEEKKSGLEIEILKEYFPMDHVLAQMMKYYQKIFHLHFIKLDNISTWCDEVITYAVFNEADNKLVGIFYLDLYPRDGKYGHYAAFTILKGQKLKEKTLYPVSAMLCNFPKPSADSPSLLPHENVKTLFHEFGHIIHQIVASTTYRRFSGTAVSRDFVEAPSQILENWVWNKDVLKEISSHYKTHKPLPGDMIDALINSRSINIGSHYIRQILLATFDQHIHSKTIEEPQEYWNKLHKKIRMIEVTPGTNFVLTFAHLMHGYEASYYGYLWAEVIADDLYETKFSNDPTSERNGLEYRQKILELGGIMDEDELIKAYLGRTFDNKAFLQKLGI